jgi:hypothetical protein
MALWPQARQRYCKFLHLASVRRELMVVPMYDIDLLWHTHISIDPSAYPHDCTAAIGRVSPPDSARPIAHLPLQSQHLLVLCRGCMPAAAAPGIMQVVLAVEWCLLPSHVLAVDGCLLPGEVLAVEGCLLPGNVHVSWDHCGFMAGRIGGYRWLPLLL